MLDYKVIKFPGWLFSTTLNTTMIRKTHAHGSHQWKPLPWFCLLRWWLWIIQVTGGAIVEWQLEWQWSNTRSASRVRFSHRLSYDSKILEYKVIKFPPWLFSTIPNTAMSRKTHAPDSHWWELLPWFCLFRRGLRRIQTTAGAAVEWQMEWQWINIRSADRVKWCHRLIYNRSMLKYKFIKFPYFPFFYKVKHRYDQEDTHAWQSPMETVTLIMPLEVMTLNNPSNIRSDSGLTFTLAVEQQ